MRRVSRQVRVNVVSRRHLVRRPPNPTLLKNLTSRTSDSADAQKRLSRELEKYVNILLTVHLFHHFLCVRCATRARFDSFSARGESFDTMRARKQQSMTSACSECPSDDVTLSANNSASALEMPRLQISQQTTHGNPLVEVEILGIPADFAKFKGKVVTRNTVNPYWQESCSFKVRKNGDRQTKKNLRFLFRSSG